MKRVLIIAIVVLMLIAMVGCNSKQPADNSANNPQTEGTKPSTESTQPNDGPFNGLVVVDTSDCAIKITTLDPDNERGYTLKAEFENKSVKKTYMFTVENCSVNGLQCDTTLVVDVDPGKKSNQDIILSDSILAKCGIEEYTDIALTFTVCEFNDLDVVDVAKKTVHVYPFGSSKATKFERTPMDSDNVIVDNENATVIVTGCEFDEASGASVELFIVNKAKKDVIFSLDKVLVNGKTANPYYTATVLEGKCAFSSITWTKAVLKKNEIDSVEDIAFVLRAYGYDDWYDEEDLVNVDVSLKP